MNAMSAATITIPAEAAVVLDTTRRNLSEADARTLTASIQRCSVRLWMLVTEAHDRKAHTALGYPTWDSYVRAELKMSPARSYQLLDQGHLPAHRAEHFHEDGLL